MNTTYALSTAETLSENTLGHTLTGLPFALLVMLVSTIMIVAMGIALIAAASLGNGIRLTPTRRISALPVLIAAVFVVALTTVGFFAGQHHRIDQRATVLTDWATPLGITITHDDAYHLVGTGTSRNHTKDSIHATRNGENIRLAWVDNNITVIPDTNN